MLWVDFVALTALIQYFVFSIFVGRARARYGIKAPATTGNEMFERHYRVQMNTLELLIIFLPSLYLAAKYWPPAWMASIGAIYLIGRIVYLRAYVKDPASRSFGFGLSIIPTLVLLVASIAGLAIATLK
jgi:uncharacterized MAPEG superfamily protein